MKYYCIGIKGSGMAALACILKDLGNEVSGYDDDTSYKYTLEGLNKRNIKVYSDNTHEIDKDTIVTYSKAFSEDHTEMKRCKNLNLRFIEYFDLMGELSKEFYTIGVSGTHGKTTVSSLLRTIIGPKANYFIGDGEGYASKENKLMIMESCEFNKHFLHYYPSLAIITNIDRDHTECYKDMDDLTNSFKEFAERAKTVVCMGDDPRIKNIKFNNKVIYYGMNETNDIYAKNIIKNEKGNTFDIYKKNEYLGTFFVPLFGDHMILNTLCAVAASLEIGININEIKEKLIHFENAKRRFKETKINDTIIIDDYAHHPTEIKATIESARQKYPNKKIIAVFMPNTYSRYRDYAEEFVETFKKADYTFLTMVSSNREKKEDYNIDSDDIIKEINGEILTDDLEELLKYKGSVFCFMSCASIYHIEEKFINLLKNSV